MSRPPSVGCAARLRTAGTGYVCSARPRCGRTLDSWFVGRCSAAGSGMLQCATAGGPGKSGHTSRTRSHRLITWSNRCSANSLRCLDAPAADVDAPFAHHAHGIGVQGLGVAAGADRLRPGAAEALQDRLGHLGPRAVARAQEQHPHRPLGRPLDRAARRQRCQRRRGQPQAGVQAPRPPRSAVRDTLPGRGCSRCPVGRPSCAAWSPAR